jgi:hypothetical protein
MTDTEWSVAEQISSTVKHDRSRGIEIRVVETRLQVTCNETPAASAQNGFKA